MNVEISFQDVEKVGRIESTLNS